MPIFMRKISINKLPIKIILYKFNNNFINSKIHYYIISNSFKNPANNDFKPFNHGAVANGPGWALCPRRGSQPRPAGIPSPKYETQKIRTAAKKEEVRLRAREV